MKWFMTTATAVSMAICTWAFLSWANVLLHNMTDCVYAPWNLFTVLF